MWGMRPGDVYENEVYNIEKMRESTMKKMYSGLFNESAGSSGFLGPSFYNK